MVSKMFGFIHCVLFFIDCPTLLVKSVCDLGEMTSSLDFAGKMRAVHGYLIILPYSKSLDYTTDLLRDFQVENGTILLYCPF